MQSCEGKKTRSLCLGYQKIAKLKWISLNKLPPFWKQAKISCHESGLQQDRKMQLWK